MKDVILKIQNLQAERDLLKARSTDAVAERKKIEGQLTQMEDKCEALKMEVLNLESELAIEKMRCVTLEDISNKLEDELTQEKATNTEYKRMLTTLQAELNKSQRIIEEYVKGAAEIRNLKIELEEQRRLLDSEIESYKLKNKFFEKRHKFWRPKPGTEYMKLPYTLNENVEAENNENAQIKVVVKSVAYKEIEPVKDIYSSESKSGKKREDIEKQAINVVRETEDIAKGTNVEETETSLDFTGYESIKKCFKWDSIFVRGQVKSVVDEFYQNKPTRLALLEITLYDHGLLHNPNEHKLFVRALIDWGILNKDTNIKRTTAGLGQKYSNLPREGYKDWPKKYQNDHNICIRIGKNLDESLKYNR